MEQNPVDRRPGGALTVLRADVEAAVVAHRNETKRVREWVLAIGGIGGTFALWAGGLRSESESVLLATFVGGWALLLGANALMAHRHRTRIARYALACPDCSEPLVELAEPRFTIKRADLMLESGLCPGCGERVFEREA